MKGKMIGLVNTLAAQIRAAVPSANRSDSMRQAWQFLKENPTAERITFQKVDGTITTRIVSKRWYDYKKPAGGPSTLKPGQIPMADLAKVFLGAFNPIISTYQHLIIN